MFLVKGITRLDIILKNKREPRRAWRQECGWREGDSAPQRPAGLQEGRGARGGKPDVGRRRIGDSKEGGREQSPGGHKVKTWETAPRVVGHTEVCPTRTVFGNAQGQDRFKKEMASSCGLKSLPPDTSECAEQHLGFGTRVHRHTARRSPHGRPAARPQTVCVANVMLYTFYYNKNSSKKRKECTEKIPLLKRKIQKPSKVPEP